MLGGFLYWDQLLTVVNRTSIRLFGNRSHRPTKPVLTDPVKSWRIPDKILTYSGRKPAFLRLRAEVLHLRTDSLHLRTEVLHLRREGLHLRTEGLHLRTEILQLRTDALHRRDKVLRLRTEVLQLRTDALHPYTRVFEGRAGGLPHGQSSGARPPYDLPGTPGLTLKTHAWALAVLVLRDPLRCLLWNSSHL